MQSQVYVLGKRRLHAQRVSLKDLRDQDLDVQILDHEERDFDETSRKSFGASAAWGAATEAIEANW